MSKLASVFTTSFGTVTSNGVVLPMVDAESSVSVPVVRVTAVVPTSLMVSPVASRKFFVVAVMPPTIMALASALSPIVMVPVEFTRESSSSLTEKVPPPVPTPIDDAIWGFNVTFPNPLSTVAGVVRVKSDPVMEIFPPAELKLSLIVTPPVWLMVNVPPAVVMVPPAGLVKVVPVL